MSLSDLAILWDLDGTIIDSTECHYKTWAAVLQKRGYPLARETFDAHYGRTNKAALPGYLGFEPDPAMLEEMTKEKEILFRQLFTEESELVPGVKSWLAAIKNAGMKQAVASSANMKNITTMLSAHNLIGYFDLLVTGANLPAKPEPAVFQRAASQLGQLPENCLVIEDSVAGVKAAKNAGMACIAVVTSHKKEQLQDADLIIDDFNRPFFDTLEILGQNLQPTPEFLE